VLYHKNCADGFGAAFCVWLYIKEQFGLAAANKIKYVGCKYSKDKIVNFSYLTGENILMCDFSYKYEQLLEIIKLCNTFMILDHHKTSLEDLVNIDDSLKIFDMKQSAVGIAWEYFFNNREMPKFLQYIQDRDLWLFKFPETNMFTTYLFEQNFTFELFESFLDQINLNKAVESGQKWSEYKEIIVRKIAKEAHQDLQMINGKLLLILYVNNVYGFASDVGNRIFEYFPMVIFLSFIHTNQIKI
jgi:oligoribonuclease NrnB/cAMP/cGMP phosphodiesterase (DHH superfamily)